VFATTVIEPEKRQCTVIHRVKWRHSTLWSHYDLYVMRQHGVLCEVKW